MNSLENNISTPDPLPASEELVLPLPGVTPESAPKEHEKPAGAINSASKFHKRIQNTKRALQTAIVVAEANHLTNEGLRYGAFGATLAETHSPVLGAVVLGGTTLLVEGAGALATTGLLSADQRGRIVNWMMKQGMKVVPEGATIPPAAEFGIAVVAGTPALMALKNIADPERTSRQNRRHGLFTASWLASAFAAEGAIFGNSVEKYNNPKMWAASAIAIGGLALAVRWSRSLIKGNSWSKVSGNIETGINPESPENQPRIKEGHELIQEQIERSAKLYSIFRDDNDQGVRIGLFGEDLEKSLRSPRSVLMSLEDESGDNYFAPLLVPIQELEWYNVELFKRLYGEDTECYYYAHPPMPSDPATMQAAINCLKSKLDKGAVIIKDQYDYLDQDELFTSLGNDESGQYEIGNVSADSVQRTVDIFAGPVNFNDITEVKEAPSIVEVYKEAVERGEFGTDPVNGVSLLETIDGDEAERIWEIYKFPFEKLGENDPTYAGFDKVSLMNILRNPEVPKIVNRADGIITSLCFFVQDFKNCPWFNPKYYEKNFPEYYRTNNIVIFPGIVSDEQMKGSSYSARLIDLAMQLYAKRGSNTLLTFECTEVSTTYIPRIVTRVINNGNAGTVSNLDHPLSTITYSVLKKVSATS